MSDEQNWAETLDDDVLADDSPSNDDRFEELPSEDYPPDVPLSVEDAGSVEVGDDVSTRAAREMPETSIAVDDIYELERAARELLQETGDDELRRALDQLVADRTDGESLRPSAERLADLLSRRSG